MHQTIHHRVSTRLGLMIAATLGALLCAVGAAAAVSPRESFLAAKQAAYDANFRNDQTGLRAAVATFARLSSDPELGPRATYFAGWSEWMIASSQLQDGKKADAVVTLESAVGRLKPLLAANPDDAESQALFAWSSMAIITADPSRGKDFGTEVLPHYRKALALAPQNPRIKMLEATMVFFGPPQGGGPEKGVAIWLEALPLLAAEKPADATMPDWGHGLAEGWLANLYLSMKPPRPAEARAMAEKALSVRPDFWYVKTQVLPKTQP